MPQPKRDVLIRVVAPHFVAGLVFESDARGARCTEAAPILRWCRGRTRASVEGYLRLKKWSWEVVRTRPGLC